MEPPYPASPHKGHGDSPNCRSVRHHTRNLQASRQDSIFAARETSLQLRPLRFPPHKFLRLSRNRLIERTKNAMMRGIKAVGPSLSEEASSISRRAASSRCCAVHCVIVDPFSETARSINERCSAVKRISNRDVLLLVTVAIPIAYVILPHITIAKLILEADQHTDRGTCLFRGFRKIEQRMWPPTTSFGAGWSTSSVKSYETVPA